MYSERAGQILSTPLVIITDKIGAPAFQWIRSYLGMLFRKTCQWARFSCQCM